MSYGRDGKTVEQVVEKVTPEIPKDHKVTTCNCCGCTVIVKPKANIPDDCPACRHSRLQATNKTKKRRIRRQ